MSSSVPLNASFFTMEVRRRPSVSAGVLLDAFGFAAFFGLEPLLFLLLFAESVVGVAEESLLRFFVGGEKRVGVVFFVDRDERAGGGFSVFSSGVEGAVTLLEGSRAKNR